MARRQISTHRNLERSYFEIGLFDYQDNGTLASFNLILQTCWWFWIKFWLRLLFTLRISMLLLLLLKHLAIASDSPNQKTWDVVGESEIRSLFQMLSVVSC